MMKGLSLLSHLIYEQTSEDIRKPDMVFETWSLWLTQKLEEDMTFRGVYLDFDSLRVKG